jgi:hypothetical protein
VLTFWVVSSNLPFQGRVVTIFASRASRALPRITIPFARFSSESLANHPTRKWESFAFLEVNDDEAKTNKKDNKDAGKDFYLISFSDNDFITQNGKFSQAIKNNRLFLF